MPAILFLSAALAGCAVSPMQAVCDVRDFGGAGDGSAVETDAVQRAIDACAGTGGTAFLPSGTWRSGTLYLRSDMELKLGAGAVLKAEPDIALFPEVSGTNPDGSTYTVRSMLIGNGIANFVLSGPGTIDGQGELFWDPDFYSLGIPRPTLPRPQPLIELADCSNTHVRGLRFENLPAYAVRFSRCDGVSAVDVTVRNDPRSPNTDGIQISDTSNAFITRADIRTGDDAIVLKSHHRLVENVVVTDSLLESDDAAIKFGTGSAVGVVNSVFSNIVIRNSRYGIAMFQIQGGVFANIRFDTIRIESGGRHPRTYPVFADIDRRTEAHRFGRIEDLTFSDIDITTTGNVLIAGNSAGPIRGLVLDDVRITVPENPFDLARPHGKPRGNVYLKAQTGSEDYAQVNSHVTLANVHDLAISGLRIREGAAGFERADVWLSNIQGGRVERPDVRAAGVAQEPDLVAEETSDLEVLP